MRIKDIEPHLNQLKLKIREIRLEGKNQVHWVICSEPNYIPNEKDPEDVTLVVFDRDGKAYTLPHFHFPEEVSDIHLMEMPLQGGKKVVCVNEEPAMFREEMYDLPL